MRDFSSYYIICRKSKSCKLNFNVLWFLKMRRLDFWGRKIRKMISMRLLNKLVLRGFRVSLLRFEFLRLKSK